MILTFAGSSHGKYTNYLLEMLCNLELESTPEYLEGFLQNWLVNPSGKPGLFVAGDKFQEQLQDEMYEHIGRKDRGFDEDYMQKVIAPNAYRFVLVKKATIEGLGLAVRAGKHAEPHTNAETRKLLQIHQDEQLHLFRAGRTYGAAHRTVDNLGRGVNSLMGGKLASWVHDTTRARRLGGTIGDDDDEDSELTQEELESELDRIDREAEMDQAMEAMETRTPGQITQTSDGELFFEFESSDDNDVEDLSEE